MGDTTFTWRYVFVGEVVIEILILVPRKQMELEPRLESPPKLSALGLGLIVLGVLKSSTWGWLAPKGALTIAGHEITPFGFSVVPFMILGGLWLLWALFAWKDRRERHHLDVLLHRPLLAIKHLRAGLSALLGQQLRVMGIFFVLPVYVQVVLGFDAFETGKKLVPLRSRCCSRRSPGRNSQPGSPLGRLFRRDSSRWPSRRSCLRARSTSS